MAESRDSSTASLSYLPAHSGDGYSFGGGVIVTIGDLSFNFGEGNRSIQVAKEVVSRWNSEEVAALHSEVHRWRNDFGRLNSVKDRIASDCAGFKAALEIIASVDDDGFTSDGHQRNYNTACRALGIKGKV